MAAIKKPERMTEKVLEFDTPVDFADAMLRVELLTKAIEIGLEQLDKASETISGLEDDLAEAKNEAITAKEEAQETLEQAAADLERIHQWIKRGNAAEAIHNLHKLMQEFDIRCTRATVVTPMIPGIAA